MLYARSNSRLHGLALLLLGLTVLGSNVAVAGFRPDARPIVLPVQPQFDIEYVIVTPQELASSFSVLAGARIAEGWSTAVITVEQIEAAYPAGRDLPERIRFFLQDAHADWNTNYLLLGGDHERLPGRVVPADGTFVDQFIDDFVTDLYYGALDGDWDGDGDGIFGEIPGLAGGSWDEHDLIAEIRVGRAPVANVAEADLFVSKTLAFDADARQSYRDRALLFAEQMDLIPGGTDLAPTCESIAQLGLVEPQTELQLTRLYENYEAFPGSFPLDHAALLAALETGDFGMVLAIASGTTDIISLPGQYFVNEDMLTLNAGGRAAVWVSIVPSTMDFRSECILEAAMLAPEGGAAFALGPTTIDYISPYRELLSAFLAAAYTNRAVTAGEAVETARENFIGVQPEASFRVFSAMSLAVFGDPTLRLAPDRATAAPHAGAASAWLRLEPAQPNPFNPRTTIRLVIDGEDDVERRVRVSVYDHRGRRVRGFAEQRLSPGAHELTWDGRDDAGRALASGVYVVRAESDGGHDSQKLTLLK